MTCGQGLVQERSSQRSSRVLRALATPRARVEDLLVRGRPAPCASSTGTGLRSGGSAAGGRLGTGGGTSVIGTSNSTLGNGYSSPAGTGSGMTGSMGNQATGGGGSTTGSDTTRPRALPAQTSESEKVDQ